MNHENIAAMSVLMIFDPRSCWLQTLCGPQSAASAIAISVASQGSWLDDCFAGDANMPDAHCEGMMQTRSTR